MAVLRIAGAYLSSPSNTYIHRDMTPSMSSMLLVCPFLVLFWPLTSHIYTKPTNSTIRFPTFPTCVSRPFFSLRLLALTLLYLLTYGPSLPCTQPSDGAYNEYISWTYSILLQNVDLQVISISVCVPVHHKRGNKDPLRGKDPSFFSDVSS